MKLSICSLKDLGAQCFGRPMFVPHSNVAVRSFMDEVNRPPSPTQQNDLFSHPDDFELYELGIFDDSSGTFDLYSSPKLLSQAKHVRQSRDAFERPNNLSLVS